MNGEAEVPGVENVESAYLIMEVLKQKAEVRGHVIGDLGGGSLQNLRADFQPGFYELDPACNNNRLLVLSSVVVNLF